MPTSRRSIVTAEGTPSLLANCEIDERVQLRRMRQLRCRRGGRRTYPAIGGGERGADARRHSTGIAL